VAERLSFGRDFLSRALELALFYDAKRVFGDPLPVAQQLSFFAHAGHVIARFADGEQRAAIFGWRAV
jgi:hypothetical protein